jgi:Ca2+-binding RTX toxin-like protein
MFTISYHFADGRSFVTDVAETASAQAQTAAIQLALTAVAANGGGGVSLSAGVWTVAGTGKAADGCLKIGSNTTLEGAGAGLTVLKLVDGASAVTGILRTDSGKTNPDGTYTTADKITVQGLSLDGNAAHTTGNVDGFYCGPKPGSAQADTQITLNHVEIMNCSRYGFDPHEQTIGLTITNSSAHHNGADGFTIDFCSTVTLSNNIAYANGRHGFNIVTGSHHVTMTGNEAFDNGGSGISVQTGDNEIRSWTDTVTISGGSVHDNGRAGIEIKQASHIDIDHVSITGNGYDGVLLAGVTHVSLVSNTFADNGGTGSVRIDGYRQDFGDNDLLNDRWIATSDVTIDGVVQGEPSVPSDVLLWDYVVTTGDDILVGSAGRDVIAAGSGKDRVNGGADDDVLYGNGGSDTLFGDGGKDRVDGGAGNDTLAGGAGNDWMIGGTGSDRMSGGSGSDTFAFAIGSGTDTVVDFVRGQDKLDITGVAAFGALSLTQKGNDTDVGFGNSHIILLGITASALTTSDFILHS